MDIVDRAHVREEELRDRYIAVARSAMTRGPSLFACEDCADPIPEERRLAVPGCRTCVECQKDRERRDRHR